MRQRTQLHDWYDRQAAWNRLRAEVDRNPRSRPPVVRPFNDFIRTPTIDPDEAAGRCGKGIEICGEGCESFGVVKES